MHAYCTYSAKFLLSCNSRTSDTENLFIDISTEEDVRTLSLITMNKSMVVDNISYIYLSGAIVLLNLHVQQCFPILIILCVLVLQNAQFWSK